MAKLKCQKHERRVHVLDDALVVHRSDGSHCDSKRVKIADVVRHPAELAGNGWQQSPEQKLLLEVFSGERHH